MYRNFKTYRPKTLPRHTLPKVAGVNFFSFWFFNLQFIIYYLLQFIIYYLLQFIIYYLLQFIIYYSLQFIIYYLLQFIICYLLQFIIYYLLQFIIYYVAFSIMSCDFLFIITWNIFFCFLTFAILCSGVLFLR